MPVLLLKCNQALVKEIITARLAQMSYFEYITSQETVILSLPLTTNLNKRDDIKTGLQANSILHSAEY